MALTFEQEFDRLLRKLDMCYQARRALYADPNFLNPMNEKWKRAKENYETAEKELETFKEAWFTARQANGLLQAAPGTKEESEPSTENMSS